MAVSHLLYPHRYIGGENMFNLFKKSKSISTNELQEKLQQSLTLLDVRTPEEYRSGHIPKAQNVPLSKIQNYKYSGHDEIYVICQSGMRSKQASQILTGKGYDTVNVRGGMNQWRGEIRGGK